MSVVGDISLPGNLQCPTHGLLSDYVLGRLDDDHFALFSQHIESCSNCQETVAAMDCLEDSFVRRLKRDCHGSQVAMSPELERWLEAAEAINDLVGRQSRNGNQAAEELPRLLGQYLLVERLGNGGMGVVYKAQHMKLKCWVALKILAPGLSLDSRSLARFHREMAAVAALNHPHIVRATDANEVGGQHFLVMEYVDGVDLAKIVRLLGPLCVPDACEVIRQAALALQHAHEAGVVHRDVKPSNLMLTSTGLVKLLDLGLARLTVNAHESEGPNTDTGQVLGTADFMAPEQALDPRSADARSDLYSLGCTLYYLLTGTAPFNAPAFDTVMKKLLAHAAAPVPLIGHRRPDVPTPIETILDRLLAKRPACRFNAARELADALQPSVHGADLLGLYRRFTTVAAADCAAQSRALVDPLSGYQVTRRPTKPRRRLRHGVTMATVFGLLVSGGICWLGWQNFLTDRAKDEPSGGGAALGVDDASDSSEQGAAELATFLGHANLPEGLRAAMLATLRQHPRARQWAGQDQGLMFALAARPLPKGDVRPAAVSPLLGTVHMVCIHELLSAKAFIDYYAAEGLTDATALRAGLLALANEISVNGRAWGSCIAPKHKETSAWPMCMPTRRS
ncbi:MAG: serine/threonine protein kinase [Gemmataceae bacterium]|nr:serine/threonine protein kinase [Gemmataceae bacterium]MDW8265657.1 serine/threonine-protein kinase [Gemmataceae bacterium]